MKYTPTLLHEGYMFPETPRWNASTMRAKERSTANSNHAWVWVFVNASRRYACWC